MFALHTQFKICATSQDESGSQNDYAVIGFEHEHDVLSYFKIASSTLEERKN